MLPACLVTSTRIVLHVFCTRVLYTPPFSRHFSLPTFLSQLCPPKLSDPYTTDFPFYPPQALESDTRVLAYEAGRKYRIRVNTISAGPLGSRAARAIGFIDQMIQYSYANAPVNKELSASEVGVVAAFLCSPLSSAVTGCTMFVDNGLNTMGLAMDSQTLSADA